MGRALQAIQKRDLPALFRFFGVEADPALIEAYQLVIQSRFAQEAQEIARLCQGLREQERFKLLREALRMSYERALLLRGVEAYA